MKESSVHAFFTTEWFAWYFDQGLMSWDDARRQLELFAEHIVPEFGGSTR